MTNKEMIAKIIEDQQALEKELCAAKKVYLEKVGNMFKDFSKAVFDLVPALKTVTWRQYTPGFNDGDPCTFDVHTPSFSNVLHEEACDKDLDLDEEFEEEDLFCATPEGSWMLKEGYGKCSYSNKAYCAAITEDQNELLSTFSKFITDNEDLMLSLFGDGSVVNLTADGATTEEYCEY